MLLSKRKLFSETSVSVAFIVNLFSLRERFIVNIMAGNGYVHLFDLIYDAINAIKKRDFVDYIEKMKGKVLSGSE